MDRETLLNKVGQISGVQGAMLLNKEGLTVANSLPESMDPNLVSAVASFVFNHIDVQSKRMQRGQTKRVFIETEQDVVSVVEADVNGESLLVFSQFGKDIDVETIDNALANI